MAIQTRTVDYDHADSSLEGLLAWDDAAREPRPAVMVAHAWGGRSRFEDNKAVELARLGYVGFALDLYGKDRRGNSREENAALMRPFVEDRAMLQSRMLASLATTRAQPEVDGSRVAAIGFCFGGLCVLDLARTGEELAGVVSFHGLFSAPGNTAGNRVQARVLALHGWDDPMATPDQAAGLAAELTAMGADWQLHAYGNTVHAFTNPNADDPEHGTVYSAVADSRSWDAMRLFLAEVLS